MKLGEFIEKFIEHNSLIRLLYQTKYGHECVHDSWDDVSMEHEILKGKGKNKDYINNQVIGITSILVTIPSIHTYAINIVIKKMENQELRKIKLEELNKNQ
jgi:hypothetical protein